MRGTAIYHAPVGDIRLDWEDGAVTALKRADADALAGEPNELTERVFRQLDEYFAGTRREFDFPVPAVRNTVSGKGVGGPAGHSLRRDAQL